MAKKWDPPPLRHIGHDYHRQGNFKHLVLPKSIPLHFRIGFPRSRRAWALKRALSLVSSPKWGPFPNALTPPEASLKGQGLPNGVTLRVYTYERLRTTCFDKMGGIPRNRENGYQLFEKIVDGHYHATAVYDTSSVGRQTKLNMLTVANLGCFFVSIIEASWPCLFAYFIGWILVWYTKRYRSEVYQVWVLACPR